MSAASSAPRAIVSGRPIPSRRSGTAYSRRSTLGLIREASANSTTARVASASVLTAEPVGVAVTSSSTSGPSEHADQDEHHRRRDRRARQPPRYASHREHGRGNGRKLPFHDVRRVLLRSGVGGHRRSAWRRRRGIALPSPRCYGGRASSSSRPAGPSRHRRRAGSRRPAPRS